MCRIVGETHEDLDKAFINKHLFRTKFVTRVLLM